LRIEKSQETRFQLGDEHKLIEILDLVNNRVPLEFEIFVVQPGISKQTLTEAQLSLLGVTETYLKERAVIQLKVIGSE